MVVRLRRRKQPKLMSVDDHLREKLKDPKFKKGYEQELKKARHLADSIKSKISRLEKLKTYYKLCYQRQLKLRAAGLCVRCAKPRNHCVNFCDACHLKNRVYERNRMREINGSKPWKKGVAGRPPFPAGKFV